MPVRLRPHQSHGPVLPVQVDRVGLVKGVPGDFHPIVIQGFVDLRLRKRMGNVVLVGQVVLGREPDISDAQVAFYNM